MAENKASQQDQQGLSPDVGGDGTPRDRGQAQQQGGAVQQQGGGEIKDKEAETSNSYGDTRDSGDRPK